MADEGIGYVISVEVDAAAVGPDLNKLQPLVEQAVTAANRELSQLGNVDAFRQISQGASTSTASLRELSAAAQASVEVLKLLDQARAAGGPGATASIGGQSIADIRASSLALSAERERQTKALSPAGQAAFQLVDTGGVKSAEELTGALTHLGFGARSTEVALRELADAGYGSLSRQAREVIEAINQQSSSIAQLNARLNENLAAYEAQTAAQRTSATAGLEGVERQVGLLGEVNTLITENTGRTDAQTVAALRQLGVAEAILAVEKQEADVTQAQLVSLAQRQLGANLASTKADAKDATLAPVAQRNAEIDARLVGLSEKQRINQLALIIAEERYNALLRNELATTVEIATARKAVETANARIAAEQATSAATSAGGGGFFGGITRGLGQSGAGGSSGSEDLGFQLGSVAKYLVYYQVFRDIERAIGDSIKETIEFERGITNLSLQLGIGRENARGLATELGNAVAVAGLAPSAGSALGAQFQSAFSLAQPGADPAALARQGADVAAKLAVVSGNKDVSKNLQDATAATQAFGLANTDVLRVLDAATTAAEHFGQAVDPSKILPGLAQLGDLAQQAGITLEQTANLLGAVQARTGDTSEAAAQELRRILGREGQPALQAVFAGQNISTAQSFGAELTQLSAKWDKLSQSEQRSILTQLGGSGGRSATAAQVVLADFGIVLSAADQSVLQGGAFVDAYDKKVKDLSGTLHQISGDFKNLAKDVGESGIFTALGLGLKVIDPLVSGFDALLQDVERLTGGVGRLTVGLGELVAVGAIIARTGVIGRVGGSIGSTVDRSFLGALPGIQDQRALRTAGTAGEAGAAAAGTDAVATAGVGVSQELKAAGETASAGILTGGTEVTAALTQVAAEIRLAQGFRLNSAGQVIGANGRFASSANTEALAAEDRAAARAALRPLPVAEGGLGSLAAEGGAAGGAAAAGIAASTALGAVLGAVIVASIAEAVSKKVDAETKAVKDIAKLSLPSSGVDASGNPVGGTAVTAEQLNSLADNAKTEAATARNASSGLIGSITNLVRGNPTGRAASQADTIAALASFQATQITAANTAAASGGGANFDLKSVTGVADEFKVLGAQGQTATQQVSALITQLRNFGSAAEGNVQTLVAGQSKLLGTQSGFEVEKGLRGQVDAATSIVKSGGNLAPDPNGNPGAAALFPHQFESDPAVRARTTALTDLGQAFSPEDLTKLFSESLTKGLADKGFTSGGKLDPTARGEVIKAAQANVNAALKSSGLDPADVDSLQSVLNKLFTDSLNTQAGTLLGKKGVKLPTDVLGPAAAVVIAQSPQVSQDASIAASVGKGDAQLGPQLAGAKAALTTDRAALAALKASSDHSANALQALSALQQKVDQDTATYATSLVAHNEALIKSIANDPGLSSLQKAQQTVTLLEQSISSTKDAEELRQLGEELGSALISLGGQSILAANSALAAEAALNTALGQAARDYATALAELSQLHVDTSSLSGILSASSGADAATIQDFRNKNQAHLTQQALAKLQAQAAGIDPRNTDALDKNSLAQAQAAVDAANKAGNNDPNDTGFSTLQKNLAEAKQKVVDDGVAFRQSQVAANAGLGKVSESSAAVQEAKIKLDSDIPGTRQFNNDLAAYKRAQTQLASAANTAAKDDPFNANLEAGIDPRDTLALAAAKLTEDAHAASSATTEKARAEGRLGLVKDQLALEQTQAAQDEAKRSAQARVGDPVSQGIASLANARQQLGLDLKGTQQYWQDYAALQNAKQALAQAELDAAKNSDALKGDPTDPVKQATDAVIEARRQLASDRKHKTGDVAADQVSVETAELAKQKAIFDQQLSNQTTAYNLHEESAQEYTKFLTAQDAALRKTLAGMHKGQAGYQQAVDELNTIDQAIQGLNDSLGGQFNLGDIKLPTVYEVRRQVAANSAGTAIDASQVHNVEVTINGADFQAVVNYLNQVLGKRGGTTVATTGRKAA